MWCRDDLWRQAGKVENFSSLPTTIQAELEALPPHARPDLYLAARNGGKSQQDALSAATIMAAYLSAVYAEKGSK